MASSILPTLNLGQCVTPLILLLCALAASSLSVPFVPDTLYLPSNDVGVRRHGAVRYGKILSAFGLVCCAILDNCVCFRWSTLLRFAGLGGSGGTTEGPFPPLHSSGSRWMIGLLIASLLNRIAALRPSWSSVSRIGGTDASISRAAIGAVRKAAQISRSALRWTRSNSFSWYLNPVHHTALAYVITGTTHPASG
ncbi:hypothetical protein C8R45DRAFT_1098296 [Mycena sanguinolenta]|nr:hypothetical protein C8R45DRAFT_1098296 [Mycena sanguinolenta]